eukprot:9886446-Karenia_brevis.AAC.1
MATSAKIAWLLHSGTRGAKAKCDFIAESSSLLRLALSFCFFSLSNWLSAVGLNDSLPDLVNL